jgi:hypothetical protein
MDMFAETAMLATVYRLPIKENNFHIPFVANKWKFAVSICIYINGNFYCLLQRKIYLHAAVCSSCKRKFIVHSFVDEETSEVIHLQTD